jgi:uncharacterized protein YbjT (DUF2867 family)
VLANPEHIGKVYDLTGPQSLTMAELAQEFSGALGRTIQYINVPPQTWEDSFQQLVGRAPISAAEFARRHAAAFTPGRSPFSPVRTFEQVR